MWRDTNGGASLFRSSITPRATWVVRPVGGLLKGQGTFQDKRRAAAAQDLQVSQASLPFPGSRQQVSRDALPNENNHGSNGVLIADPTASYNQPLSTSQWTTDAGGMSHASGPGQDAVLGPVKD